MDYWELKALVSKIIPRMTVLKLNDRHQDAVREKGRKSGYHQFNIRHEEMRKQERLLNTEEVSSFVEISLRAAACPMPLNIDTWDGLLCPYGCIYCFANAFRASLYTAFFDNGKTMGFRHANPDFYMTELDKLLKVRGTDPHEVKGDIAKAVAMDIPMRFGIRFEDFMAPERRSGVSLTLLKYLSGEEYPVMINTKSALVGQEDYLEALSGNKAKAAVHITMISSDEDFLKKIEPGAPPFERRLWAAKQLVDAGVRVVARIEPFLPFMNDGKEAVQEYMEKLWETGVRNITFDTYSYTAHNPGIRQSFVKEGYDFERMFLLGCDSQAIGSILLGKFMELFRDFGYSCSTFDMGNAPSNDDSICCEVGDWFEGGFNNGSTVMAARYIKEQAGKAVSWGQFREWVNSKGGFLSEALELSVHELWNMGGNSAYGAHWSQGLKACGWDDNGMLWKYDAEYDFREEILNNLI